MLYISRVCLGLGGTRLGQKRSSHLVSQDIRSKRSRKEPKMVRHKNGPKSAVGGGKADLRSGWYGRISWQN